jgi:hypothetical protein
MHGPLHRHATELLCRLGQPKVNENTSIPELRNWISNCRSTMGFFCRISWYIRGSVTVPLPSSSTSTP